MIAASSCRCRALLVGRREHRPLFLFSYEHRRARVGRVSLLSSHYARLQSSEDEKRDENDSDMNRYKPRVAHRRPLSPPPIRARPIPPPTMESDESSNVYSDFPEYDATAHDYETYDPNTDGEAYGFFSDQHGYETETRTFSNAVSRVDASKVRLPGVGTSVSSFDLRDTVMPPIEDPYMNSPLQEDVPNPHNYWDVDEEDDDDLHAEEAHINNASKATAAAKNESTTSPTPLSKPKRAPTQVKVSIPPSMPPRESFASEPPNDRNQVYAKASSGDAITTDVEILTTQLLQLEQDIYAQNNNREFNINSAKQVSKILFGRDGQSTNKETLEAMGGAGNVIADLILQYRRLSRKIMRLKKKKRDRTNGTLVTNISKTRRSSTKNSEVAKKSNVEVIEGDPLLLVDASAYIFRAYYSMPPLHRADGMPVGAVLGFCNMLNRLVLTRMLNGECPRLVLVFDAKGKNFRHDMYEDYKANRPECPVDLIPQFDLIRDAAAAYGIQQLEAPNFEADDVIATLATMALNEGVDTNILSGDKDLMQLITPQDVFPAIEMVDPMTMSRVSHDVVVEKWGVSSDKLGDVLALAGDSADNVPGVPGIGPKIASTLISEYGSLEELLEQIDSVKQKGRREKLKDNVEMARLSRRLVDLERDVPLESMTFPENMTNVAKLRMAPMDGDRLLAFYETMGLKDMKRRVEARINQTKVVSSRKNKYKKPKAEIPKPDDYKDVPF